MSVRMRGWGVGRGGLLILLYDNNTPPPIKLGKSRSESKREIVKKVKLWKVETAKLDNGQEQEREEERHWQF